VRALEEKIAAQSKLLAAQQAQLTALQASLEEQAAALAQQRRLLESMIAAAAGSTAVSVPQRENAGIPQAQNIAAKEAPRLAPAGPEVAMTALPRIPLPDSQSPIGSNIVLEASHESAQTPPARNIADKEAPALTPVGVEVAMTALPRTPLPNLQAPTGSSIVSEVPTGILPTRTTGEEAPALAPAGPEVALTALPLIPLPNQQASSMTANNIVKQAPPEERNVKQITHWYDKYSIRGYVQIRHNGLQETNDAYTCDQCDKSIGPNNNFFLRRARLVISGNVSEHVYVYIQPDFASSSGSSQNYAQLRDFYFDVSFDKKKEHRIRAGLSKIPFGFENLQSSQNRLDFDRSDALNSSFANERDIGIFYYWAPAHIRARFNELVTKGLKGSGDYGVFGAGAFNGQILNTPEANSNLHYVARYTYPFKLGNGQFIETSIQGFTGKYTVTNTGDTTRGQPGFKYDDRRIAGSLIIYPQPFGFQAEYNWGIGPQYIPSKNYIDQRALNGGYALLNYMRRFRTDLVFTPYFRFQYYDGGKKQELDARRYLVREGDLGIEMQFGKYIELTPQYQYGVRTFEDSSKPNNRQKGGLLRLQLQFNY
jgi:hypothetical protein